VILDKKRRLSQTDSGKSRKPTSQPAAAVTAVVMPDSKQEIVVNGDIPHTPVDITMEDSSHAKDDVSNAKPQSFVLHTNNMVEEDTSPPESQHPAASCSGKIVAIQ